MTGRRHDPDAELMAQGTGNLVAPFLGGFAATGAIARTATTVRSGGCTPIALDRPLPKGVVVCEIAGPLFFGAAQKAMAALEQVVIEGARPQPLRAIARTGWSDRRGRAAVYRAFERAVDEVRKAFE